MTPPVSWAIMRLIAARQGTKAALRFMSITSRYDSSDQSAVGVQGFRAMPPATFTKPLMGP